MLSFIELPLYKQDQSMSMASKTNVGREWPTNGIPSATPTAVAMLDCLADDEARNKQETLHLQHPGSASLGAALDYNMGHSSDVQDDKQEINDVAHGEITPTIHQTTGVYS